MPQRTTTRRTADLLTAAQFGVVLGRLLAAHPELHDEADTIATDLLGSVAAMRLVVAL